MAHPWEGRDFFAYKHMRSYNLERGTRELLRDFINYSPIKLH